MNFFKKWRRKLTVYYVGPSLYGYMPEPLPNEVWRGPAKQGDILRDVIKLKPRQVVLIDGTFNQTLAVWHKELVYAMLQGVKCVGAASMGALRAADMHRYGMIGIGEIYDSYSCGRTEDDSQVMLQFEPETYKPLSLPPVGSELKRKDALQAIAYARTNMDPPRCTLKRDAISPALQVVIDRILEG
jgi:hypothetical protein